MKLMRHLIIFALFAAASAQATVPCPMRLASSAADAAQEEWRGSGLSFAVFEEWLESLPKDEELSGIVAFAALSELLAVQDPPLVMVPSGHTSILGGTTRLVHRLGWIELQEPLEDFSFSLLYYHWEALSHGHPAWNFESVVGWLKKYTQVDFSEAAIANAINVGLAEKSPHDRIELETGPTFGSAQRAREPIFGIGVELTFFDGQVAVLNTFPGTPAASSGLVTGDRIVELAGEKTEGKALSEVAALMDHQARSEGRVTLTVLREGERHTFHLTPQQYIYPANVDSRVVELHGKKLGLLRLKTFLDPSAERDMAKALDDLRREKVEGLVLDLRGNLGGQLDVAIKIAGYFLGKGVHVATEKSFKVKAQIQHKTHSAARIDVPILVLTDAGTASAAELLAGVLRHYKKAYLVGTSTYGKGSVQYANPRTREAAVFAPLPVAFMETRSIYHLPSGWSPQHVGLRPDIRVPQPFLPSSVHPDDREASAGTSLYLNQPKEVLEDDPMRDHLLTFAVTLGMRPPDLDYQKTSALELLVEFIRLRGRRP